MLINSYLYRYIFYDVILVNQNRKLFYIESDEFHVIFNIVFLMKKFESLLKNTNLLCNYRQRVKSTDSFYENR